ncbi:PqqD family peptide modification chaperone [Brachybacterium sp. DNPG3]
MEETVEDVRYRLGHVVVDGDELGFWVGRLPDGPIMRMNGSGAMILEVLLDSQDAEHGKGMSAMEVASRLRDDVDGLPDGIEVEVDEFLISLAEQGVLVPERRPSAGPAREAGER